MVSSQVPLSERMDQSTSIPSQPNAFTATSGKMTGVSLGANCAAQMLKLLAEQTIPEARASKSILSMERDSDGGLAMNMGDCVGKSLIKPKALSGSSEKTHIGHLPHVVSNLLRASCRY